MKSRHRSHHEVREQRRRRWRWLGIALLVAGFWGLVYLFAISGPSPVPAEAVGTTAESLEGEQPELTAWRSEVAALRGERGVVPEGIAEDMEAEIARMDRAVRLQQRVVANSPLSRQSEEEALLNQLVEERDHFAGEQLHTHLRRAVQAAESAVESSAFEESLEQFERAILLQERINREYSRSPYRSTQRAAGLRRTQRELLARPVYEALQAALAHARSHEAAGEVAEAAHFYEEALRLHEQVQRDHRETRYADSGRHERIRRSLLALATREHVAIRDALEEKARQHEVEGAWEAAVAAWRDTVRVQREIIQDFPESPDASPTRLANLESSLQRARMRERTERLQGLRVTWRGAMARGEFQTAASALTEAARMQNQWESDPNVSAAFDPLLGEEIAFLLRTQPVWELMLGTVEAGLVPLGDEGGVFLFQQQTNQSLYEMVMDANPSARQGAAYPVESVTYAEGERFCQRLGWLLGRTARLPTVGELRTAAGNPSPEEIARTAWHSRNSEGQTQPIGSREPNQRGFHDLPGNVAEWAYRETGGTPTAAAPVFGGSVRDPPSRLQELPVQEADPMERNRFRGFRFVVVPE